MKTKLGENFAAEMWFKLADGYIEQGDFWEACEILGERAASLIATDKGRYEELCFSLPPVYLKTVEDWETVKREDERREKERQKRARREEYQKKRIAERQRKRAEEERAARKARQAWATEEAARRVRLREQERMAAERERAERVAEEAEREALKQKVAEVRAVIGEIDGKKLDEQQLRCIAKSAPSHLVVAGAGTGKTLTMVGKICYLLKSGKCRPEEILALSFTNKAAEELAARLSKEGVNCPVMTFHSLGKGILAAAGRPNAVDERVLPEVLERGMAELGADFQSKMLEYIEKYNVKPASEFDFSTQAEYDEYLQLNPPVTLMGERVKSYGELLIANFLLRRGVEYRYEAEYRAEGLMNAVPGAELSAASETDLRSGGHRQYHPDFYLPEYGIYLEYFAVDRQGRAPEYFRPGYVEGMAWKRRLHAQNGTQMIECYAYENLEGILERELSARLARVGVKMRERGEAEMWQEINNRRGGNTALWVAQQRIATIINQMKASRLEMEDLTERNRSVADDSGRAHNQALISLVGPVKELYDKALATQGIIDFNDMINLAADCVRAGEYTHPYKYVVIDEYQDISMARYGLVRALREARDFELMAVGDDWQSIYRFAGSDLGLFVDFAEYWGDFGEVALSKIEQTYRFSQKLADESGEFIMKNPRQLRKSLRGRGDSETSGVGFGIVSGAELGRSSAKSGPIEVIRAYTEQKMVDFMLQRWDKLPQGSTVLLLGRYNNDNRILRWGMMGADAQVETLYNNREGVLEVKYRRRPDLKMRFMTVHKAKGLEADYVFVLNNSNGVRGFPSRVQNNSLIRLIISDADVFPYEEERRLFYVALTRAKKKVFLLAQDPPAEWESAEQPSVFIDEIEQIETGEEMPFIGF